MYSSYQLFLLRAYRSDNLLSDTFLFQLRAFQQMRGTVLNPTQVQRSLDGIQQALRQMMSNLLSSNIPWFAELFTDLLLQIGLVPMQELDADILKNVTDKDRLQVGIKLSHNTKKWTISKLVSNPYLTFFQRNFIVDLLLRWRKRIKAVNRSSFVTTQGLARRLNIFSPAIKSFSSCSLRQWTLILLTSTFRSGLFI